ncbi:MAG: hypothetical protein KDC73_00780 [Ignavibacteriae bacterium]|nr:hypothetical protein [Ignavibacteriota bacterium]MCB9243053.1 hypothetical protein [Ignavibacteriales bacterium]
MEKIKNNVRIHFFYIVLILSLIIITLLTLYLGGVKIIVDYFTFGMTLTSMALAVLAIVYAYISNASFHNIVGSLKDVSQDIEENALTLNNATSDLKNKIEHVTESISEIITESTDKTHKRLDSFIEKVESSANVSKEIPTKDNIDKVNDETIKSLLKYSSFSGLIALYIANYSFSSTKEISLYKFDDVYRISLYYQGFLVALNSMRITSGAHSASLKVTAINDYISANIEKELIARIEKEKQTHPKSTWETSFTKVKDILASL